MDTHANTHAKDIPIIKSFVPSWSSFASEDFHFERLPGFSNQVWKVSLPHSNVEPQCIVYRIFGPTYSIIDRKKENYILNSLSSLGVGPKVYGGNDEFRVEKFYESRTMTTDEFRKLPMRRYLAKSLANLHSAQLEDLSKTPAFERILEDRSYIHKVQEVANKKVYIPEERNMVDDILSLTTEEEIGFLKSVLPKNHGKAVLSHNDLYPLNALVLDNTREILIIDYEFADSNYRGFDIATIFNEVAFGFISEYPYYTYTEENCLTEEETYDFVQYYLFFSKFEVKAEQANLIIEDETLLKAFFDEHYHPEKLRQDIDEIFGEVRACVLFTHYYWMMWNVITCGGIESNDAVNHLPFGHFRYKLYQKQKSKHFSQKNL